MKKQPHQKRTFKQSAEVAKWLSDNTCYLCDKKDESNHAHHIDKNPYNNNLRNIVVLCKQCHELTHKTDHDFDNIGRYYALRTAVKLENMIINSK